MVMGVLGVGLGFGIKNGPVSSVFCQEVVVDTVSFSFCSE